MSILKKAFIILGGLLLLGLFSFPIMGEAGGLELNYPKIPGIATTPTSESSLAQYLAYLYYLVVDIVGVVAFIILIVGGIQYLTSAGSVNKAKAARHRIIGGGAGLLIVLGAFMILRTINPQLVGLEPVKPIPLHGVCLYRFRGTEDEEMYCLDENTAKILPEDFYANEIEIEGPQSEFRTVFLFPEKNYQGDVGKLANPLLVRPGIGKERPSFHLSQSPRSIYFDDHSYGVYLFPHGGGEYTEETFQDFPKNLPVVLTGSISDLENFNDRAQSLYLLTTYEGWLYSIAENLAEGLSISGYDPSYDPFFDPDLFDSDLDIDGGFGVGDPFFGSFGFDSDLDLDATFGVPSIDELSDMFSSPFHSDYNWGAILHTNTNGEGECGIVYPPQGTYNKVVASLDEIDLHPIDRIRSVDIFNLHQHPEDLQGSVTFCAKPNFEGDCYTIPASELSGGIWQETIEYPWNGIEAQIYSVKMEGNFWVVLTSGEELSGNCQTFLASNADLKSEYVLNARAYEDTKVRSAAIIPTVPLGE